MKVLTAKSLCVNCAREVEVIAELCQVCQAAEDLEELLNLSRRVRYSTGRSFTDVEC